MRTNGLRPRAIGALSVVAASLFLLLCLANYGQGGYESAGEAPWHLGIAGWFVEVFGAGAFALVLLPLVWGLVVYFREDTPSLGMRVAGTLLLACSIAMVAGLVQGPEPAWAGAIGEYTVALAAGLGGVVGTGLAKALAYAAALSLFLASFVWATDWWFHSLRKGPVVPVLPSTPRIETEPVRVELWGDDDVEADDSDVAEREHVSMPTAGANAAAHVDAEPFAGHEPAPVEEVPDGFSAQSAGDRLLVQGPAAYEGVEFLPPSDELAPLEEPEERLLNDEEMVVSGVLDDELDVFEEEYERHAPADDDEAEAEAAQAESVAPAADHTPAPIATVEETVGAPIFVDDEIDVAARAVTEAVVGSEIEDRAPTEPEAGERRSGIGLPDDSPFVDEFFAVDVLVSEAVVAGDGASADGEVEAAFGTSIPATESPESTVVDEPTPPPAAEVVAEPEPAPSAPVIVDELLFADAYDIVDDELPAPVVARSQAPASEPEPDSGDITGELEQIHDMQLDPLFHDAVDVVLEAGRGTAMTLQRRFGIGHGRGLRLLEQMQTAGILAPEDAAGTREVRITPADWRAFSETTAS